MLRTLSAKEMRVKKFYAFFEINYFVKSRLCKMFLPTAGGLVLLRFLKAAKNACKISFPMIVLIEFERRVCLFNLSEFRRSKRFRRRNLFSEFVLRNKWQDCFKKDR
jgi:hypothetical protein